MIDPIQYGKEFELNDKLGNLLGCKFISISKEECIYEYEVNESHFNPNGILHGGALFIAMDSCQGCFIHFILENEFKSAATGTAKIRYNAPLEKGKILIKTKLIEAKDRKRILQSIAINEEGKEVASLEEIWICIKNE